MWLLEAKSFICRSHAVPQLFKLRYLLFSQHFLLLMFLSTSSSMYNISSWFLYLHSFRITTTGPLGMDTRTMVTLRAQRSSLIDTTTNVCMLCVQHPPRSSCQSVYQSLNHPMRQPSASHFDETSLAMGQSPQYKVAAAPALHVQ